MVVSLVFLFCLFGPCLCVPFQHDIDYQHPESGERVRLQSNGRLKETIDLDRIPGIKRVICDKSKVLIAAETNTIAKSWKAGQVILGSSKWDCHRNTLGSQTKGIYARIQTVLFPTETGIVVHTEKAGAFDVIDEADIKFHYHPGQETSHPPDVRRRHRRYFANMLSELLHNIDWRANFSTTVPWNYDMKDKQKGPDFRLVPSGNSSLETQFGSINSTDEEVFEFSCKECHGISSFSYTFEMVIKKNAMNQPDIHHYLSKLESNCTMFLDTNLETQHPMRVDLSRTVLVTPPKVLFTIPVAVVEDVRIPPVTLTVNYNSETHINVNMTAADKVSSDHRFNISGSYKIVQQYTRNDGMDGYVTASNWTVVNQQSKTTTNKDLEMTTTVYQKMNVTTSIGWLARDMDIIFSPPVTFRIKPIIETVSSTKGVERCVVDTLHVTGDFNVSDARLTVEAFDVPIWDTVLADGFNRSEDILDERLYKLCSADCFPPETTDEYKNAEEVVGTMTHKITRQDSSFMGLQRMIGNSVLFASEEAETSVWCGYPGRKCVQCTYTSTGNDTCADRMMTSSLASKTSLLGKYVTAEWPERKLVVHEAWDEATSVNPNGQHGNASLHYEGRAAIYSVTSGGNQSSISTDNSDSTVTRLKELAVCSKFPYVARDDNNNLIHVAVKKEEPIKMKRMREKPDNSKDKLSFEKSLSKLGVIVSPDTCPDAKLSLGSHWPTTYSDETKACGGVWMKYDRANTNAMKTLYEYTDSDVRFVNEGPPNTECGMGRECKDCSRPSMKEDPWDWCGTRIMSPRIALRLKRLAVLASKDDDLKNGKVTVTKAYEDGTANLYNNGRALTLTFTLSEHAIQSKIPKLASLAVCAGFDYVKFTNTDFIEVFVKEQAGYRTTLIPYPSGQIFIAVDPPVNKPDEFTFPESLARESRKPSLLRSLDDTIPLSKHFTIGDFKDKSTPYLRVDASIVECLDLIKDSFKEPIDIMKAFTTKSSHNELNSEWDQSQLDRFQSGQAVVIQQEDQTMEKTMDLAKLLMSTCTPSLRMQRRGLELSIKQNGFCTSQSKLNGATYCIYVGLYPMERTPERQYVKLQVSDGSRRTSSRNTNEGPWSELKEYKSELLAGGPQVIPMSDHVCKPPDLGEGNGHFSFKLHHIGFCLGFGKKKHCIETLKPRQDVVDKLYKQLSATAQNLVPAIKTDITECLVTHCGGCPGAGPKWDKKVKACVKLIDAYISYTNKPLVSQSDNVAFFNTENEKSAAHGLACKNGTKCVENVQLYSILHTTLTSKYKPDPNNSIEELIFDGHDNPSPLLEIVEQQTAIGVHGNVSVFIENVRDVSALRNVLKVLMIYNRNIKHVKFLTLRGVKNDKLASTIQRKIETWAGSACPKWSRFAVTPYSIESVPAPREARSIEDGTHRNKMKEKQRNWEIDWIMMT